MNPKEDFIPYEQAMQMHDLGYDDNAYYYYHLCNTPELKDIYMADWFLHTALAFNSGCPTIPAPLYQEAFRWFRQKHHLTSVINCPTEYTAFWMINDYDNHAAKYSCVHNSYENAQQSSLKTMIEIVQHRK